MSTISQFDTPLPPVARWASIGNGNYRLVAETWWADVSVWWSYIHKAWMSMVIQSTSTILNHEQVGQIALDLIHPKEQA